jgi:hypothetical protein
VPSKVSGQDRLLRAWPGKDPLPLVDAGQTRPPVTRVGKDRLALVEGPEKEAQVVLGLIQDDEVVERRPLAGVPAAGLTALAASHNGKVIYFVRERAVWAVPAAGGQPRRITNGDGVAAYPDGKALLVQRFEGKGVRLFRVPADGGEGEELQVKGERRLVPEVIGGLAINEDGRALVASAAPGSWFWQPALLDLARGKLEPIVLGYEADVYPSNWGRDGTVLGMAYPLRSDIWRFRPPDPAAGLP